mmetsp:Transcript_53200/g.99784  ORF Transcript_53200/g.99784 Transcript_53200/m.99784 type:complete len:214 (+) Transcript_53200:569-1210(+)
MGLPSAVKPSCTSGQASCSSLYTWRASAECNRLLMPVDSRNCTVSRSFCSADATSKLHDLRNRQWQAGKPPSFSMLLRASADVSRRSDIRCCNSSTRESRTKTGDTSLPLVDLAGDPSTCDTFSSEFASLGSEAAVVGALALAFPHAASSSQEYHSEFCLSAGIDWRCSEFAGTVNSTCSAGSACPEAPHARTRGSPRRLQVITTDMATATEG